MVNLTDLPFDPAALPILAERLQSELNKRQEKERLEANLIDFVEAAWPVIDPAPYQGNWHIDAICEHLEAVAEGRIRKLLVNVPPRHSKTLLCSVLWPCWIWAQEPDADFPLIGPQAKFLCLSYAEKVVFDSAITARRLLESDWYQSRWGDHVRITTDQAAKEKFDTTAGGSRISAPMGGQVLGRGGNIRIIDDPNKADDANYPNQLEATIRTYEETLRSRITDPRITATVTIMQRLSDLDLSGHLLETEPDTVHLYLPEEYDSRRHCVTVLGLDDQGDEVTWQDPRTIDGQLLWPERFDEDYLRPFRLNAYVWSGQYQQSPAPRGGGIFKREWWQVYPPEGEQFHPVTNKPLKTLNLPPMDHIIASLDTAMTTKEENDFSALTVIGVWRNEYDLPKLMLLDAWQARLEFRQLVDRVIFSCMENRVDRLLIEAKVNGFSVAQEIGRLLIGKEFAVSIVPVKGDIVARAHAVSHLLETGLVYAPDRKWADLVIDNMAVLPKGAHDDLASSMIQGLKHLRDTGFALLRDERESDLARRHSLRASKPARLPYAI